MKQSGWCLQFAAVLTLAFVGLWAVDAEAQRTQTAQVPVQVSVGPTGNLFGGPTFDDQIGWGGRAFEDQPIHTGLRLRVAAVIDSELVRRHPGLVPRQHRGRFQGGAEVRYAPPVLALIPSSIYLSPPIADIQGWESSAWGATWTLMALGVPLLTDPFRFTVRGGVIASAIYMSSEQLPDHYFFLRPGAELSVELEVPITDDFLISVGWASLLHVPQSLHGGLFDVGGFDDDSLWHIGQFFIQGHIRIPYSHEYVRQR